MMKISGGNHSVRGYRGDGSGTRRRNADGAQGHRLYRRGEYNRYRRNSSRGYNGRSHDLRGEVNSHYQKARLDKGMVNTYKKSRGNNASEETNEEVLVVVETSDDGMEEI